MQRLLVLTMLSLTLALVGVDQASARGSRIAKVMGDLRWGMSEGDVIRHVERQLKKKYMPMIRKQSNMRQEEALRDELRAKTQAFRKSLVEFDGKSTNWDASNVAGEYTHGNAESMLVAKDRDSSTYYFFIDGNLWKWIKTYDSSVFGGPNFKKFANTIKKKFGKGRFKNGKRNPERAQQKWLEYIDRQSRMRAVDDTEFYGKFALVFEEMSTVRDLASLRTNTIRKGKKKHSAVAGLSRDFDPKESDRSVVDNITGKDRRNAGRLKHKKRGSLFAEEQQQESESQYEARRKKAEAAQRAKQRRQRLRAERKKAAKALEGVPAEGDDDPLSGL